MNERYIKWYTPWLSREFEMLAFGNGGGLPLIILPTSFGRRDMLPYYLSVL
jgi:esterase/lipase superfamily enzyme